VDTGWLLVGGAGVAGGLALVLVGAGIATAPLLLPVGALLAVVAYLAWAAGTSHIVASVYDGVDDPDPSTADARTGRPEDRVDPDGNWRSTAADGGRTAGADAGATGGVGPGAGAGIGPDDEPIWDAAERDRAGGWDDWEADPSWTDRRWNGFRRGHNDRTGGTDSTRRGGGTRGRTRSGRRTARDDDRTGDRSSRRRERTSTRQQRAHGGESSRRSRRGDRRRRGRTRRRDGQARRARDLLEVDPDATEEALRTAYRERVKEVHPDRGGDPEQFKRVQWAYEYLTERGE